MEPVKDKGCVPTAVGRQGRVRTQGSETRVRMGVCYLTMQQGKQLHSPSSADSRGHGEERRTWHGVMAWLWLSSRLEGNSWQVFIEVQVTNLKINLSSVYTRHYVLGITGHSTLNQTYNI